MKGFSHTFRSISSLWLQLACCSIGACYAQQSSPAAYFVVAGDYNSSYQSPSNTSVAYHGTYNQTDWKISQDGLSIIGSAGPSSAGASYHVEYSWLNGALTNPAGEQWTRSAKESIAIYVLGPPGTPFSVTYSFSAKVSAGDFSSPCSNGYTLAYFQGQQTVYVLADHVGLTPSMTVSDVRTISGVTQKQILADPSGMGQVYSLAWTYSTSTGIETGDSASTSCSPAQFTGSATVDAMVGLAVNSALPSLAGSPLKDKLAPVQTVINQLCTALAAQSLSPLGGTQVPLEIVGPACWATESYKNILDATPDPNYTAIDQPLVPYIAPLVVQTGSPRAEAAAVNNMNTNQLQAAAYATAISAALGRSQGAYYAGDSYWQQKQDEVKAQFTVQLGAILNVQRNRLSMANAGLSGAGVGPFIITANDVSDLQTSLANKGVPAPFLTGLSNLGAKASDVVKLQALILGQDTSSFPKIFPDMLTDPDLMDNLDKTSDALLTDKSCAADVTASVTLSRGKILPDSTPGKFTQRVTLTNSGSGAIFGPISLVLDRLSGNASLLNSSGGTLCSSGVPLHRVFVNFNIPANTLDPGESAIVELQFGNPSQRAITYSTRVLAGQGIR
jgi:hypothetical protein